MCGIWTGQDPLIVDGSLGLYIKQDGKNDEDDIYFKISDERKGINAVRNMIQDWIDRDISCQVRWILISISCIKPRG